MAARKTYEEKLAAFKAALVEEKAAEAEARRRKCRRCNDKSPTSPTALYCADCFPSVKREVMKEIALNRELQRKLKGLSGPERLAYYESLKVP